MHNIKKLSKRTILYSVISALVFLALFCLTFRDRAKEEGLLQAKVVTFGDSVFGEVRDNTAVPCLLQEYLGETVYNGAMGGTCAARTEELKRMDYPKGSLSLVGLAKALYAGDFGVQKSGVFRESMMEYFPEVIDGLAALDFSETELVLIQHGLNDYHAGIPIENPDNPYDEYSFLGALRSSVELLKKANPNVRIVLVTPTYTWYLSQGKTCEEVDFGGGVLAEYVNAEMALAEEMGLEVIDLYHDYLPNEMFEDYALYSKDGVHPNEEGRRMMAWKIVEALTH